MIRGKILQKLLSSREKLFFETIFSVNLLGPKEMFLSFPQSMSKHLVDPYNVFFVIFHVRWNEKKEAKVFSSLERLPRFSQLCVLNNLLGPKKRSFIFQSKCQTSLWTLIKCSLMFVTLDDTRKRGQKLFSTWKQLFFEMFVPVDPSVPKEIIWSFAQFLST